MRLALADGHTVDLTPWTLRAVRDALPLAGDEERMAPSVPDRWVGEALAREGLAARGGNGDLVLTRRGRELHRLAAAPEPGTGEQGAGDGSGRLTYSSELTPGELARARAAEEGLRAGARAFRWCEPLPAPARYAVGAGMVLLGVLPVIAAWLLDRLLGGVGAPFLLSLVLLVVAGQGAIVGGAARLRRARRASAPGQVLRRHAGRCLVPASLDPVARALLLRVQRAVDSSPDPAALAVREWDLARELAGHTLRRARVEGLDDPDERVLGLIDLLGALARTEERVRALEEGAATRG